MMPSTRISISLVAISCVGLLLFCNSGVPQEANQANSRIQQLQKRRLVVLRSVSETTEAQYKSARAPYAAVFAAKAALLAARIEYAETKQSRIALYDEAIKNALDMQDVASERAKGPEGSQVDALNAEAYVLDLQIRREKAAAE